MKHIDIVFAYIVQIGMQNGGIYNTCYTFGHKLISWFLIIVTLLKAGYGSSNDVFRKKIKKRVFDVF